MALARGSLSDSADMFMSLNSFSGSQSLGVRSSQVMLRNAPASGAAGAGLATGAFVADAPSGWLRTGAFCANADVSSAQAVAVQRTLGAIRMSDSR